MVLGKLDSYIWNDKVRTLLTPYTKINAKWIKDLNIRPETLKFPGKNIGSTLFDLRLSNIFLDLSPQAKATKAKQTVFTQWGRLSTKLKANLPNEKIFSKDVTDKALISKI